VVFKKLGTDFALDGSRTVNACSPLLSVFSLHSEKFQKQTEHNRSSLQTSSIGTRAGEEVEQREEGVSRYASSVTCANCKLKLRVPLKKHI